MQVALIVPTLNGGALWKEWVKHFLAQSFRPEQLLVIDSTSDDQTVDVAVTHGFRVHTINRTEFNHGKTRQLGVTLLPNTDIYIFLTQDALLHSPQSLQNIVASFADLKVGCAYGRQQPHAWASAIAAHARYFNYPTTSSRKTKEVIPQLGFKSAFISNSFAAYRREALLAVGGFPSDVIFAEDACVAARMLLAGWDIQYCAEAAVRHSHNYSVMEEFRRYFDVGVFHTKERWILDHFGSPGGEGFRFVKSEMSYLAAKAPHLVPMAAVRTVAKLVAYRLGKAEKHIPLAMKKKLSMNRGYWSKLG